MQPKAFPILIAIRMIQAEIAAIARNVAVAAIAIGRVAKLVETIARVAEAAVGLASDAEVPSVERALPPTVQQTKLYLEKWLRLKAVQAWMSTL